MANRTTWDEPVQKAEQVPGRIGLTPAAHEDVVIWVRIGYVQEAAVALARRRSAVAAAVVFHQLPRREKAVLARAQVLCRRL